MINPPANRLRVDDNDSNGIRNSMYGILQFMAAAIKRCIAIFNAAGGRRNGKILQNERSESRAVEVVTPKTSNMAGASEEHTSLAPKLISMGETLSSRSSTATLTTESGQEHLF